MTSGRQREPKNWHNRGTIPEGNKISIVEEILGQCVQRDGKGSVLAVGLGRDRSNRKETGSMEQETLQRASLGSRQRRQDKR